MREMELIAIWQLVKRRWWLILLPAVVTLVLTLPTLPNILSPPVTYLVQVRLTAAAPPSPESEGVTTPYEDSVYVPLLASEYVAVMLPHWITSDSFAAEVSALLDQSDTTIDDLEGAFAADSFRSILTLYVVWDKPGEIRLIADAALEVLETRSQSYFPQFAAEPVQVIPLDEVDVTEMAPPITTRITPLIRVMVGLAAGVGLAVLAEYLDRTVRGPEDLKALGLAVLAEIPRER
jgi:capsular polysaccharide biosynthesis protein